MTVTTETPQITGEGARPWYKEGWLWFVISIPAVSVPLGIAMIVIALNTNNSLVVDDYYVQGKTINLRIERDQYASAEGISAKTTSSAAGLTISLASESASFQYPEVLLVRWVHVTQGSRDGAMQLFRVTGSNQYFGPWPVVAEDAVAVAEDAVYRIHLEPENRQWRLVGELGELQSSQHLMAKPARTD